MPLILVVIPLGLTIWLLIYAARQATRLVGTCKGCGYDLRNLEDQRHCPECGRAFRLDDKGNAISE